ncbi:hypothetical protein BG005_009176 [Podila minutissima]|nr:hypothetical protein BG005_009176 [Podila minutissima]
MAVQSILCADNGETIPLLADYASSSTSAEPTSTKATNSLSDHTQSDDKVDLESIPHDNVDPVPQVNLESVVLSPQPTPEQFQGLHQGVALPLPLSAMLALRNLVRQVLNANTAVSVACLVLYQVMLPTLEMRTRIFLQSALWAVVLVTHRSLFNGYLPFVLLPSIAMAWIWHETYLGRVTSFAVHGVVGEPVRDTCPHGSVACQALFGMVVTTVMSALCFSTEIGHCLYIVYGPHGNMWLQDGDERLMANFLRGHRHEELFQHLRDAEGHAMQDRFTTQDEFMAEMLPVVSVAPRPMHAQLVDVGYAHVPVASASRAFHIDFASDEETLADDEFSQSSEDDDESFQSSASEDADSDDDYSDDADNDDADNDDDYSDDVDNDDDDSDDDDNDDDDDDDAEPYQVNIVSYATHIEPSTAAQMSAFAADPLKTLAPEMGSKSVATSVQPCSVDDNKAESASLPEILSPVPHRPRVSALLYSQLSLTKAAYMPVRSTPHHMVQPPVAASFYHEAQFEETPLSSVASPPVPFPLDVAVPAAVYSYDDPIRSIGSVVLFKNYSAVDQECIRRRLAWAQAMVDKENAAVQATLVMVMSLSDDDEEGDEGEEDEEDEIADDEYESEDSEEEDEDEEDECRSPSLAGTLAQEMEDDQDDWDVHALLAQAHAVQELLDEDDQVLEPFKFYSTSDDDDDEGDYPVDSEGQVLAWLCANKFLFSP